VFTTSQLFFFGLHQSDDKRFSIELTSGKVCELSSPKRDIILATLLDMAKWNDHRSLAIVIKPCLSSLPFPMMYSWRRTIGSFDPTYNNKDYFLKRTMKLGEKVDDV
jgi:hypothetical protein